MSLLRELSSLVGDAFVEAGLERRLGEVVVSHRPDLAQFQCNGALAGANQAGRDPRSLAGDVAATIARDSRIASTDVAGPGFVNINVTNDYLADWLGRTARHDQLGIDQVDEPHTVIIDYGGPNVAKDLHVGHIRPALIGESIKRIYAAAGHTAVGDVHLGDWGLPMGQLIAALEDAHPELPYFDETETDFPESSPVTVEDLQELYPKAASRFGEEPDFQTRARAAMVALQAGRAGYRALWSHFRSVSVNDLKHTYDRLGVSFELWHGEASVASRATELVAELRASGVAVGSDGAVVIPVADALDTVEVPPLMLVNSRGGATYATTDLATIEERVEEFDAREIVYVVDLRQSLHFTQLFRAARRAGVVGPDVALTHAGNGTVNGPDGKPFKTRQGGLPRLRSLLDDVQRLAMRRLDENELATDLADTERGEVARTVGLAALKFGELSNHRTTNYSFDLERFTQMQGRTGPYLLYVAVRTKSILDRLVAHDIQPGAFVAPSHDTERALVLALLQWPEVIAHALEAHSPSTIAEHAYELCGVFNQFYDACHILSETNEAVQRSWLALVALTRSVLLAALDLLLIEVPDRM